ncbi:glutaredoxin family protein [Enterococcus saccharolyticus]|uniref:NrdH-redoxin n=1 Tax=Candidatus Enterococcus willemsii TaxID=1857215 RepID=A0ABQ6Z0F4_9ENTE|nr:MULTISPECIES: glutaredoxin family protein [Enterococcus]KAF1304055.1 NrdH-redoxin [Enterococcus sp. CU12B]MCD5002084.1 glutaredoxin family protein [Enterococcus saccharolyticus]
MTQINEAKVILWAKDGCHYCQEIKTYFQENKVAYQVIDVTQQDNFRDILFAKYGVRYVPVVEIAPSDSNVYQGITELGLEHVIEGLHTVGSGVHE